MRYIPYFRATGSAQMVIQKVEQANLVAVTEIETTIRGEGGFGHTGKK